MNHFDNINAKQSPTSMTHQQQDITTSHWTTTFLSYKWRNNISQLEGSIIKLTNNTQCSVSTLSKLWLVWVINMYSPHLQVVSSKSMYACTSFRTLYQPSILHINSSTEINRRRLFCSKFWGNLCHVAIIVERKFNSIGCIPSMELKIATLCYYNIWWHRMDITIGKSQ